VLENTQSYPIMCSGPKCRTYIVQLKARHELQFLNGLNQDTHICLSQLMTDYVIIAFIRVQRIVNLRLCKPEPHFCSRNSWPTLKNNVMTFVNGHYRDRDRSHCERLKRDSVGETQEGE